jgi:hypothetical protein
MKLPDLKIEDVTYQSKITRPKVKSEIKIEPIDMWFPDSYYKK